MKKVCFLLAFLLMFGCVCGYGEEEKYSFEITFEINPALAEHAQSTVYWGGEAVDPALYTGLVEAEKQVTKSTNDLLNLLSAKGIIGGENLAMDIFLKDKSMLSIAQQVDEAGYHMYFNLIPSYILFLSAEDALEMGASQDTEQLTAELTGSALQILYDAMAKLEAYWSEPEAGTFEMNGRLYTEKQSIAIPAEDLFRILGEAYAELIPLMEKVLVLSGQAGDEEAMQKAVEEAKSMEVPEDVKGMVLCADMYMKAGEDAYENDLFQVITIKQAEQEQAIGFAQAGVKGEEVTLDLTFSMDGEYQTWEDMKAAYDEKAADVVNLSMGIEMGLVPQFRLEAVMDAAYIGFFAQLEITESGEMLIGVQLKKEKDGPDMVTAQLKAAPFTGEWPALATEGKEIFDLGQLLALQKAAMTEEVPEDDAQTFEDFFTPTEMDRIIDPLMQDMEKAVNGFVINAIVAAPEEVQALMDAQTLREREVMNIIFNQIPNNTLTIPDEESSF